MAEEKHDEIKSFNRLLEARREHKNRIVELTLWVIIAFVLSGRIWLFSIMKGYFAPDLIQEFYFDFILFIILILFPILFKLIFGLLPIQYIRWSRLTKPNGNQVTIVKHKEGLEKKDDVSLTYNEMVPKDLDPQDILFSLSKFSKNLSERIFTRSGVYLMIGVLIAFTGLVFFYTQTINSGASSKESWLTQLGILAPRFGVLFFIEFIAFFFLRQYRSAMEEFRYFEAIQRRREETFALIRFMKEEEGKIDIKLLIESENFFSTAGKLAPGETTELLESRKLTKDEIDIFTRIIEAVSSSKIKI